MLEIRKIDSYNMHTHDRRESQYYLALNKTAQASQTAPVVKNPSAKQETKEAPVQSLGQEIQGLRPCAPAARDLGSIPSKGAKDPTYRN